jgi:ribose transport system permease protein
LSGIHVDAVRITTYVMSGVAAGIAGMIYVGRVGTGQGNVGVDIELTVIAAVLIGGTAIAGGEGAIWRTAVGVALLAVLQNYFNQENINSYWQSVVQGGIILVAVAFESYGKRKFKKPLKFLFGDVFTRGHYSESVSADGTASDPISVTRVENS